MSTALLAICLQALTTAAAPCADKPMNVLFIAVDDLRPELGCYGDASVKSPNIDRLAATGTVFNRAYCQQAVCSPSRVSLLLGQRPDTTGCTDLQTKFRSIQPDIVTLPQYFKNNGYHSYRLGKIFHLGHGQSEDEASWTTVAKVKAKRLINAPKGTRPTVEAADVPDNLYSDGAYTEDAIQAMKRFKESGEPFFLAVGYHNPHLPFAVPGKYWDMYDRDTIPDSRVPHRPEGASRLAIGDFGELRKYDGIPLEGPLSPEQTRELQHGYRAAVSFIDAQVGRLMAAIEETGFRDNTIVILWGDHGYKLNDYASWCKHTTMEVDTRVPLILAVPGYAGGQHSEALVEFVDIYPTLARLCNLDIPEQCEGISLRPLLENPCTSWKQAAFSQWPRGSAMGYSIRSGDWRYTEWIDKKNGRVIDREMYNHAIDSLATENQIEDPALAATVEELSRILDKGQGWKVVNKEVLDRLNQSPRCN